MRKTHWSSAIAPALLVLGVSALFYYGKGAGPRNSAQTLVGAPAPEFAGRTLDGGAFRSTELRGQVAVVVFWASWCATCLADEPKLAALQKRFAADSRFRVVGVVTQDSLENARQHVAAHNRPYLNVFDEKGTAAALYGVHGVQATFVFDAKGIVVDRVVGPVDAPKLEGRVAALLR